MTKKPWTLFLLVGLLFAGTYQRTYTEIYDAYCSADVLASFEMTEDERISRRGSLKGAYVSVDSIVDVIQNKSASKILKEAGAYIILMIILTVLCLISFLTFLGFCCCCDRAGGNTVGKAKLYAFFTFVFIVTFAALFIALLVFLGKLNTRKSETGCVLASIPKDLLDGVNTSGLSFIGFKQLSNILTRFKNDLTNLSSVSADFDNIISQNLASASQTALASLPPFYNKYKDSKTSDGAGSSGKPLTIQSLTTGINDAIYAEFKIFDDVSTKITQAAQTGKQYAQDASSTASIQSSISSIVTQINNFTDQIDSSFGQAVTGVDYFNQYAPIGYWLTLGFGLLVAILGTIAFCLIVRMIRSSTDSCRMGVKFCLSFNGFLIFLLGIIAVVLLVASISLNSVCHAVGDVLNASDVASEVAKYQLQIDPLINNIINQCIPRNASGDVSSLLTGNVNVYNQTQTFMDGITLYDSLKKNITQAGDSSPTIAATVTYWTSFKTSVLPDQPAAVAALSQLNDLVKCGGTTYQLNSQNCTESGCQGIYQSSGFSAPSCSSNGAQATTFYTNLKAFTTDEDALLGKMITDLSGSDASTPLSLNNASRSKVKAVFTSFDNIKAKLQGTVDLVSNFTNGFASSLNCTVLRRELNNLESSFCFAFNQNLYYFAVLLIWIVFFLFFYSWCICYSLRYMPAPDGNLSTRKVDNAGNTFYVQDDERVPVY